MQYLLICSSPRPLQKNEVEQLIWKAVHYRPIEEFRSRLRIAGQAVQEQQQHAVQTVQDRGSGGDLAASLPPSGDAKAQQQKLQVSERTEFVFEF